jgi:hypothetical protein
MYQQRLHILTERIERLEKDLRFWKALVWLAALVVLCLTAFFALPVGTSAGAEDKEYTIAVPPEVFQMGQPQALELVKARRVVLVDSEGEVRAALAVSETGNPHLDLFGQSGRTLASLSVKGSGSPSLVFYDRMGRVVWRAP